MDNCLVLLAHGSKDPRWRLPFERIADAVRAQSTKTRVRLAYMEFTGPSLMDVARECVDERISRLKILPLFLSTGAHLATDIPDQANQAKAQFPQLEIEILPPIGEDSRLAALIQQIVIEKLNQ